ncbi:equilibrative nucleoside transporter 3-like [Zophobas morio]|uniref:equilibrative nucleoside transporter 3-like n=1 Tax=Zophobas morio TaxID=2755281 RepID=UPI00308357A4
MANEIKEKSKVSLTLNIHPEKNEETDAPEDKFYIVYTLFFLMGLVHLLPWSFFNTANGYWMYKFRNTTTNDTDSKFRTTLQAEFNASIMITLQVSQVAFLIIGLLYGRFISVRVRFIGILSIILFLFVALTAFVKIDTDSWQEGFFAMVMIITFGINSMNSVFTITLYTAISNFPHHYLAPYLAGGGISTIFTALLQILSLATGLSVQNSASVYFILGVLVIAFTLIFVVITTSRNQFYLHHMNNYTKNQEEKHVGFKEGIRLFKKVWSPVAMMGLFMITTNMSPTTLVASEGEGNGLWNDKYFVPIITFLLYAVCDLVGRTLAFRFAPKNLPGTVWVLIAFVRMAVIIPLFMLCNAQPRHHLPVVLPHDYQYILVVISGAISGGYIVSRSTYNTASLVKPEELKDAYHVQMLLIGVETGILSFLTIVSVDLL